MAETKTPQAEPVPESLAKHPLVGAMSDGKIGVHHAADLLVVKAEELAARLTVKYGGVPPQMNTIIEKAREAQWWAADLAQVLNEAQKPAIEVVGAMPDLG